MKAKSVQISLEVLVTGSCVQLLYTLVMGLWRESLGIISIIAEVYDFLTGSKKECRQVSCCVGADFSYIVSNV